jgi:uncharacterized protein (TIGR03437 family)
MNKQILTAILALALPAAALADITDQTLTIPIGSSVNMETGTVVTSGGDLKWDGILLTPQNGAKAAYIGPGDALYQSQNLQTLQSSAGAIVDTLPIAVGPLTGGSVLVVLTTAGHWAKLEVTTTSTPLSIPLPIKITTYGAGGGSGGPTITKVVNNSSNIPAGFPNSGISQGALFKVLGSGFGDPNDPNNHSSEGAGLQATLNGASIDVTVAGTTVHPALYYAGPTQKPDSDDSSTPRQLSAVLPTSTPIGTGTLTVTFNGVASNTFPIQVVTAAPGITTYNNGATVVAQDFARPTDPYGGLVTFQKSAVPGGTLTIWGSGFGATSDDDVKYTASPHATSISYTLYIGGIQANILYAGRSQYPGVHIFVVTVPQNVPTGCYVPIAAVATVSGNSIVSNVATLPIHAGGGACSDPQLGINGDQLSGLTGSLKSGFLVVSQITAQGSGTINLAGAFFQQTSGVSGPNGSSIVSIGGCVLTQTISGGSTGTTTALNAGTITVTGPGGTQATLTANPLAPGFYAAFLTSIPSTGGAYVFNGTAGSQVGAFTATVDFPNPLLSWTNQAAAATVARSQGFTATWSGGAPGSYVLITGTSASGSASGSYTCYAPQSAGTFTVPSYILLGLPAGSGTTTIQNSTNVTTFSATGLEFGAAFGNVQFSVNSNYN